MLRSKHLTADSECPLPPSDPSTLRVYSMLFCPFAQRVFLVAVAKGIKLDVTNVNVTPRPEWLSHKYPGGKVPLLETSVGVISESLTISEFLDQLPSTSRPLRNQDLFLRTQDQNWAERFQAVIGTIVKLFFGDPITDREQAAALLHELAGNLQPFEKELIRRKTRFFSRGEQAGVLDYMMWPFIERFPVLKMLYGQLLSGFDFGFVGSCPTLAAWMEAMKEERAVKETMLTPEQHFKYISGRRAGNIDYDFLMQ